MKRPFYYGKWYISFNEGRNFNDWVPEITLRVGYQNRYATGRRYGVWGYFSAWRCSFHFGTSYYPTEAKTI